MMHTDLFKDTLFLSYMEIYNEQIFDLLAAPTQAGAAVGMGPAAANEARRNLPIRDRGGKSVVDGLSKHAIASVDEAMSLLSSGAKVRATGSNNINADSSRSHSVCGLELVRGADLQSATTQAAAAAMNAAASAVAAADDSKAAAEAVAAEAAAHVRADPPSTSLWIVDLAGSERGERTGMGGTSKKQAEANNINVSLFTLMSCLSSMRENGPGGSGGAKRNPSALPAGRFRESKLTRLLAPHLSGTIAGPGGAGRTCMIVNANPAASDFAETRFVLSQAAPCTRIKVASQLHQPSAMMLAASARFDLDGRRIRAGLAAAKFAGGAAAKGAKKRAAAGALLDADKATVGLNNGGGRAHRPRLEGCKNATTTSNPLLAEGSDASSSEEMAALRYENECLRAELAAQEEKLEAVEMEVREECALEMASLMGQYGSGGSNRSANASGDDVVSDLPTAATVAMMLPPPPVPTGSAAAADEEDSEPSQPQQNGGAMPSARKRKQREDLERLIDDLQERCDDLEDELSTSRNQNAQLQAQLVEKDASHGARAAADGSSDAASSAAGGDDDVNQWRVLDLLASLLSHHSNCDSLAAERVKLGVALKESKRAPLRQVYTKVAMLHNNNDDDDGDKVGSGVEQSCAVGVEEAAELANALREALFPEGTRAVAALAVAQQELTQLRANEATVAAAEADVEVPVKPATTSTTPAADRKSCAQPPKTLAEKAAVAWNEEVPVVENSSTCEASTRNAEASGETVATEVSPQDTSSAAPNAMESEESNDEAKEKENSEADNPEEDGPEPAQEEDEEENAEQSQEDAEPALPDLKTSAGERVSGGSKQPLTTLDPNSPRAAKVLPSKYSPGVVGRTQMRIREIANVKKAKTTAANEPKKRAFSPRKTRSSTIMAIRH